MISAVNSANVQNSNKKSYVKNGAAIGAVVGLGYMTIKAKKAYRRNVFGKAAKELIKNCGASKNEAISATLGAFAIAAAAVIGVVSAVGAGIGAIVKAVKGDKAAKEA